MTEQSADVVPDLVRKRGPTGRCSYNLEAKCELARRCARPGVSVARMALAHGVNANQLRRWVVQYGIAKASPGKANGSERSAPVLLPVTTQASEVKGQDPGSRDGCIEILWAAATVRLRGAVDVRSLSAVLDCLAQRA